MSRGSHPIRYPRLRLPRALMRSLIRHALGTIADVRVQGEENIPKEGPLLLVANHFHYLDPVAMIFVAPWPLEFLAGSITPNAPRSLSWLRKLWGVFPVHRGSFSRSALRSAEAVLRQGGVLGVFPEAGSWAAVLRGARPGSAYLAVRTGVRILPMAFTGLVEVFPELRAGRRARVNFRIGRPFGPFQISGRGRERREQLDDVGHQIMRQIADLLPEEKRGLYASDPEIRAAAAEVADYPWDDRAEI